jgi:8-oxo-dGTP pyrophosphatase MutT (NUDIX family)
VSQDSPLEDRLEPRPVLEARTVYAGMIWDVVRERVDLGEAGPVEREFVRHPGAVSVVALDGHDRIALVQQYRHPVRVLEWELPAGLLDVGGEPPWLAAARELHEEADLAAGRWDVLAEYFSSPGGMDEALRVYLARDLSPVPEDERHQREHEEHGMPLRWIELDEALGAVLAGRLHNPSTVIGVLAAHASRELGWTTLRPHDTPWPAHPAHRDQS